MVKKMFRIIRLGTYLLDRVSFRVRIMVKLLIKVLTGGEKMEKYPNHQ